MAYPLIILGAGASHDSLAVSEFPNRTVLKQYQPPLSNNLFDTLRFSDLLDPYEDEISQLVAICKSKLKGGEQNLEEVLTELRYNRIGSNPDIANQIIAMRYYLADLFHTVTNAYFKGSNNYSHLVTLINQTGRKAMVVNFNYDLLFERSVFNKKMPEEVNAYMGNDIQICKIHGAYNWYFVRKINAYDSKGESSYHFAQIGAQNILENEEQNLERGYEIKIIDIDAATSLKSRRIDSFSAYMYLPALALPLQGKTGHVCPDPHLENLERKMEEVDRVIIIGWSAGDSYFLDVLKQKLEGKNIPLAIVTGKNSSNDLAQRLESVSSNIVTLNDEGFSSFLNTGQCEKFLHAEL